MPAKGLPQLVDGLCIMTFLLAGLCCQVKAPQSAQPEKPEVPTTSEPFSCSVRVLAAVTDCDQTKEAMVNDNSPLGHRQMCELVSGVRFSSVLGSRG